MLSYITYTIILITLAFTRFSDSYKSNNRFKLAFLLSIMLFMGSFRAYTIGNDTQSYYKFFQQIEHGNVNFDSRIEIGYRYFNLFVSIFSSDFTWVLFLSSLFFFTTLFKLFRKYSNNYIVCGILFWLIGFIPIISATRQAIAIAFICIAMGFLFNDKIIWFIISVVIGSLFHASALLFIILLPLSRVKLDIKKVSYIVVLVTIISLFTSVFNGLILNFLDSYYINYLGRSSGIIAVLFNTLMGLVYILLDELKKIKTTKSDEISKVYLISKWCTLLYACLSLASYNIGVIGRLSYYFIPGMILYMSHVLSNRKILTFVSIVILILYNLFALWLRPEWNSFFPFSFR